LFFEDTEINLQNIKLKNISTNGRDLINSLYNDLTVNGLDVKNIACYGDMEDYLILI